MRVLVCEPQAEVRALLGHVVERLGHEPVFPSQLRGETVTTWDVDVVLVEPADPDARAAALALLGDKRGGIPVVCVSLDPDAGHAGELRPAAYLVKPFGLAELERALADAVAGTQAA
jgi:CheY-like chemotaxis protein